MFETCSFSSMQTCCCPFDCNNQPHLVILRTSIIVLFHDTLALLNSRSNIVVPMGNSHGVIDLPLPLQALPLGLVHMGEAADVCCNTVRAIVRVQSAPCPPSALMLGKLSCKIFRLAHVVLVKVADRDKHVNVSSGVCQEADVTRRVWKYLRVFHHTGR